MEQFALTVKNSPMEMSNVGGKQLIALAKPPTATTRRRSVMTNISTHQIIWLGKIACSPFVPISLMKTKGMLVCTTVLTGISRASLIQFSSVLSGIIAFKTKKILMNVYLNVIGFAVPITLERRVLEINRTAIGYCVISVHRRMRKSAPNPQSTGRSLNVQ